MSSPSTCSLCVWPRALGVIGGFAAHLASTQEPLAGVCAGHHSHRHQPGMGPHLRVVTWSGPSPEPPNPLVSPQGVALGTGQDSRAHEPLTLERQGIQGCCPHKRAGLGTGVARSVAVGPSVPSLGPGLQLDGGGRDMLPLAPAEPTCPCVLALPLPGPPQAGGVRGACSGAQQSSTAPGLAFEAQSTHLYANAGYDPGGASWAPSQVSAGCEGGAWGVWCVQGAGQQGWATVGSRAL